MIGPSDPQQGGGRVVRRLGLPQQGHGLVQQGERGLGLLQAFGRPGGVRQGPGLHAGLLGLLRGRGARPVEC